MARSCLLGDGRQRASKALIAHLGSARSGSSGSGPTPTWTIRARKRRSTASGSNAKGCCAAGTAMARRARRDRLLPAQGGLGALPAPRPRCACRGRSAGSVRLRAERRSSRAPSSAPPLFPAEAADRQPDTERRPHGDHAQVADVRRQRCALDDRARQPVDQVLERQRLGDRPSGTPARLRAS